MTNFLLFGGKGGVGKTTCAAATALKLAKQGKKVLVVSTDPAHSLSDSFETKIGNKEKKIAENLYAVEIDPNENLEALKKKLGEEQKTIPENIPQIPGLDISKLSSQLGGVVGDLESMPGIDEIAAFNKFLEYMNNQDYDVVIFDTAPTGHTLKFLSLPELMDSWVGRMLKFRIQIANAIQMFKQILPFSQSSEKDKSLEQLEEMKKRIKKGRLILTNPKQSTFTLVLIPQEMAIAESLRAEKQLKDYGIVVQNVITNQIQPPQSNCVFCKERRKLHEQKLKEIRKKFKKAKLIEIPLFKEEITGFKELEKFAQNL